MGGMGKTTLAQLVYNDATINESFDLKAWVCVSDYFDAIAITKAILQSITSESCDYSNLDLLQVKLKEKLSGKRFLLVLDDIWNENYNDWTILRSPFGAGTHIIVTTRLQIVSSIVDPLKAFHLDKLSDDDCLSIFTQHALKARNFDGHLQFKEIGEKIVRRCNGLPLAAKAIGSLLRTVTYHGKWERICESEIWNLPEEQCGIIPALRLSYHHLPSYLKRCFAYCSILPKDYEFVEEEIILLWRAEGLLQQQAMPQIKDLRNQYFQDLVSRLHKLPSKMENLVNLQYLDIRDTYLVHEMPFGIDKLTNLQRLFDFIIGEGDGHRMRELKYLSNLKGDFCLSWLDNVNCQDAREAKLNEKLGIDRLALHWSINLKKDTRNKEVEECVLDSLRPPKKLEHLVIQNYGGAKFSTWIADSSFKNLLSLELHSCENGKSLPSIARLPLLKNLSICFLHEVHKIGVELFGVNQSNAFASLETLRFENVRNWKEWDPCEDDEQASKFPNLLELSIIGCPQLLGRLPTLQSLQKLEIDACRRLVVSISSFSSLRELSIDWCEELVDGGSSSAEEVTSLKYVSLKNISKFDISAEKETLDISGWNELESLSQNGLGLVGHRFNKITDCPQLVSLETEEILQLDKTPVVESLEISST
ncbi:putative disease resistance RPP13-like protein 1 [Gossypium hirsutum]|uniref:Disease resistance RPP13-like protein 1 n=1 Tax=Gossypium hirsutum TaxID=3635 RepID=A0ABM3B034_GOSHI|nr:putative disease resistance RPP13-like protein 1 [Gossypium hirsutum]